MELQNYKKTITALSVPKEVLQQNKVWLGETATTSHINEHRDWPLKGHHLCCHSYFLTCWLLAHAGLCTLCFQNTALAVL